jgi:membrane protein implicated in regulation of membrane protease activity
MRVIGSIAGVFWTICLGAVALFVFFSATGAISPAEVLWLTIAVSVIALLALIHFLHVRRALDHRDHRHDDLARSVHAMRERRGF